MIDAQNISAARRILIDQGDVVLSLSSTERATRFTLEKREKLSHRSAAAFAQELASLLKAGAPLRRALVIMNEGDGNSAQLAKSVLSAIDRGEAFTDSIKVLGGAGEVLAHFLEAGESGIGLEFGASEAARFLTAHADARDKISGALAYPIFVLCLALVALLVIVIFVAPAVAPALNGGGTAIQFMAHFGNFLHAHATVLLIGLAGCIGVAYFFRRRLRLADATIALTNKIGFVRDLRRDLSVGPAATVAGELLRAGVSAPSAFQTAANIAGEPARSGFFETAERIKDGATVGSAIASIRVFPNDLRRLSRLGEETGSLGAAITEAGTLCQARAMRRIQRGAAIAGPALVIIIGGGVALMMISVLMGLSNVGDYL